VVGEFSPQRALWRVDFNSLSGLQRPDGDEKVKVRYNFTSNSFQVVEKEIQKCHIIFLDNYYYNAVQLIT
jgi:hypothetical protein